MVINRITTNVDGAARLPRRIRSARRPLHLTLHRAGPASLSARELAQEILKVPETQVRVISENVGGGFGMKGGALPRISLRRSLRSFSAGR